MNINTSYKIIIPSIAVAVLLVAGDFLFAAWTPPSAPPPGGNTPTPINVGTTNQLKLGDLTVLRSKAGLQMWSPEYCDENGQNCWDPAGGSTASSSIDFSSCQLERTYVQSPDGQGPWAYSDGRDTCLILMTQEAIDDGWMPTGSDACAEDGNTCTRDGIVCHYARLTCAGAQIPTTFRQYDTPADAAADNFWNRSS